MKIYDISKEVFSSTVFPGDPVPGHQPVSELAKGDLCNLTALTLGSHSGTHMDAPCHFVEGGKTIDQVDLARCVGPCQVVEASGLLSREWAKSVLGTGVKRLLVKGEMQLSLEAAQELAESLLLLGIEGMTVGDPQDPAPIHKALLSAEVAVLESCDLSQVPTGEYFLAAQPLKYGGLDGAQVRPLLLEGVNC